MDQTEQQFLNDLDKKLWSSADKLRSNLDAAVYKHAVLGLIFVKYVSDAFEERRKELEAHFHDKDHDYYLGDDEALIQEELEVRDYYTEKNVFWVPELARWKTLQDNAKLPIGTEITIKNGKTTKYKITSVGRLIDDALDAIEKENPKLKGVLNKSYASLQLDAAKLGELIDLVATIPFHHASLGAKDILGHVYEYFLGQFALAEGKKGGQYYTPKAIVTLIVEMLQPYKGRVYDPAMGSGGFFVQSENFIEEHQGKLGNISVYGQESNPTTWRLAPKGSMALLLANGSMSSNTNNEGEIRKNLLENDLVECMVALPGQLFTNTQIPACIWFLTKNKKARNGFRDRKGEVLFIDARDLGYMKDRVLRDFKSEDIRTIADTYHAWKAEEQTIKVGDETLQYEDQAGFCKSVSLDDIKQHDYVITPGRYVGAAEEEDDGEPFAEKMARLTTQLKEQFELSDNLENEIRKNLAGLGYEL